MKLIFNMMQPAKGPIVCLFIAHINLCLYFIVISSYIVMYIIYIKHICKQYLFYTITNYI